MPAPRRPSKNPAVAPDPAPPSHSLSLSRLPKVKAKVGLSRSAIYSLKAQGKFPAPITLGRSILWIDSEIDEFIQQRMQARNAS